MSIDLTKTQLTRLREIDRQLRADSYPNCQRLAARLKLSRKTIQRYFNYMRQEWKAPLAYDYVHKGYYYTDKTWLTPTLHLTEGELLQLLLAERMAEQLKGTPLAEGLDSMFQKIKALMTEKVSVDPAVFRKQVSFHSAPHREISKPIWSTIFKALREDRVLLIEYSNPAKPRVSKREIEPVHLACVDGEWYLVAFDRSHDAMRYFAVSRVRSARITKEHFPFHEFDPDEYFSNRFGRFIGEPGDCYDIKLRFKKSAVPWVMERQWHPRQTTKTNKDGSLILSFPAPSLYEVKRWVLQWGRDVEVIGPDELKAEVTK